MTETIRRIGRARLTHVNAAPARRGKIDEGPPRWRAASGEVDDGCQGALFREKARDKLMAGIDTLAEAVKVTLGPRGKTVILEQEFGAPRIVNSGVVVARSIELADRFENMGAQLLREVAARTSEMAGDGTTTATVLAHSLIHQGMKYVTAGHGRAGAQARHRTGGPGRRRGAGAPDPHVLQRGGDLARRDDLGERRPDGGDLIARADTGERHDRRADPESTPDLS
jgi:hypothetical protein